MRLSNALPKCTLGQDVHINDLALIIEIKQFLRDETNNNNGIHNIK